MKLQRLSAKAQMNKLLLDLALPLLGLVVVVLLLIYFNQNVNYDESTCRFSVAAREQFHLKGVLGSLAKSGAGTPIAPPLLCSTRPATLTGNKDQITKQIADNLAKCWWQYGQGQITDAFKSGTYEFFGGTKQCRVCYTLTIKNKDYSISGSDLLKYLHQTTYISEQDNKTKKQNNISYLQYIQNYAGEGNVLLTDVHYPEIYAVAYGVKTKNCGSWCTYTGAITGGLVGGTAGVKVGLALCAIPLVGWSSCAAAFPISVAVASGIGYFAGAELTQGAVSLSEAISTRPIDTVYIVPLNEVRKGDLCNVYE